MKKPNGLINITNNLINRQLFTAPIQQLNNQFFNTRYELLTLQRHLLSEKYSTDGIYKTLVDQPVLDAFRGELKIESKTIGSDELEELNNYLYNHNILNTVKQLFIWNRLFGGAALIIETDNQNLADKLIINEDININFFAVDRWELSSENFFSNYFCYYGHKINRNRLILLKGIEAPSLIEQQLGGWGLSCLEPLVVPSNTYNKLRNLIYELIDESKIDVFKLKGLNDQAMANMDSVVVSRVEIANMLKNYLHSLVLDSEDNYEQKQLNLTGLKDLLDQVRLEICSALKMPLIKVYGVPTAGFSSGDTDLENYNSFIESEIRPDVYRVLKLVIKYICKSLFGIIPKDLKLSFPSLRILNDEQLENIKDKQLTRALNLFDRKQLTSKELAEYLKNNNIVNMNTKALRGELDDYEEDYYNNSLNFDDNNNIETDKT